MPVELRGLSRRSPVLRKPIAPSSRLIRVLSRASPLTTLVKTPGEGLRHDLKKLFFHPWLPEACHETSLQSPAVISVTTAICGYCYDWNVLATMMTMDCLGCLI